MLEDKIDKMMYNIINIFLILSCIVYIMTEYVFGKEPGPVVRIKLSMVDLKIWGRHKNVNYFSEYQVSPRSKPIKESLAEGDVTSEVDESGGYLTVHIGPRKFKVFANNMLQIIEENKLQCDRDLEVYACKLDRLTSALKRSVLADSFPVHLVESGDGKKDAAPKLSLYLVGEGEQQQGVFTLMCKVLAAESGLEIDVCGNVASIEAKDLSADKVDAYIRKSVVLQNITSGVRSKTNFAAGATKKEKSDKIISYSYYVPVYPLAYELVSLGEDCGGPIYTVEMSVKGKKVLFGVKHNYSKVIVYKGDASSEQSIEDFNPF